MRQAEWYLAEPTGRRVVLQFTIDVASLMIIALLAAPAFGQDNTQDAETEKKFSGDARLGFESTTGNTDTFSLAAQISARYLHGVWEYSGRLSGSGRQDNRINAEEQYHSELKAERHFGQKNYLYGQILYDRDRFAGVVRQLYETIGFGRQILKTETQELNLEVGVGTRQTRLADDTEADDPVIQLGGDYHWQINENVSFTQELTVNYGSDNTYAMSLTTLESQLTGNLSMVLSYRVDNNSEVPLGSLKTDTKTILALGYRF
jgi:putative salt-induced outer membrane protein